MMQIKGMRREIVAVVASACALWLSTVAVPPVAATVDVQRDQLLEQTTTHTASSPWRFEDFPSPDQSTCHGGDSRRLCDPDSMLSQKDVELLADALADTPSRTVSLRQKCLSSTPSQTDVAVQYGVAVMKKMNLDAPSLAANREDVDAAAEVFARHIHDDWGVGLQTTPSCGGTGVLIFLAIDDRAVYISRGSAVESVLSNRRLDKTIQAMKPDLLERNYGQALLLAIRELDSLLLVGGPDWKERSVDFVVEYLTYFVFAAFFGIVAVAARHEQRQRREYAAVASHLNELDRSRAEALQGRFQAKSCPICLESFMFADDNPSSESNENETAPLMCTGSDGLPLKLLRCGHVFDDTCWAEWISSGHHGKINKCPICQQDVGQSTDTATTATAGANTFSTRTDGIIQTDGLHEEEARQRALRQYTHDRNFRLLRLATRYPRYVRPQQLQTWSQVGYDGSLARDPSFVNSDPARQSASSGNGNGNGYRRSSGGGASGFGGGMSGGGRGGRW